MKKSWTRLLNMVAKQGMSPAEKEHKFGILFLEHHRNAEEIISGKNGKPILAIYMSPQAYHRLEIKDLIQKIKNEYLMEWEK